MSELPDGWIKVPLGDVNEFSGSTVNPASRPDELFELYSVPSFPTGKPERLRGSEIGSTKQTVNAGDVLISKINPRINRVWTVGPKSSEEQIASSEWIGFRSEAVKPAFANYYFRSQEFRDLLCSEVAGVGGSLTRAQPKRVAAYPLPIAPLAEQTRIADQLDTLLTRINACNDHLDAIPGILRRFRQAVLNAAAGDDFLGNAPEAPFHVVQLHTVLAEPLRNGKSVRDGAGLSVLRLTSLKPSGLDLKESKAGDWSGVPNVKRFLIQNGDYLVSRGNGSKDRVGLGGLVNGCKEDLAFPDTMIRIRPDQAKLLPEYLNYVWSSQLVRQQIEQVAKTTAGIWKVSQPDLESISFPLPDLDEQREIVSQVDGLLKLANRIEARYAAMRAHAQRLPPQVLAKAFRGELVEQDPQDEPASQLLGRLRAVRANAAADRSKERAKTLGKRPIMSNADIDSIKAEIMKLESDRFSFNELKARIACDYETLKTSLFALLEEPKPVVRQVFDEACKEVRFVRVGA